MKADAWNRAGALLAGAFLLGVYHQLGQVQPFRAAAGRQFTLLAPEELRFWLAHWLVAAPGLVLVAWGLRDPLGRGLAGAGRWLRGLSPRAWRLLGVAFTAMLVAAALVGRSLLLHDGPITDDENMVTFGARMLLAGDWAVPVLQPDGAFTQVYTYRRDGLVSSFDYPGALLFRAAAIASGLDSALYAVAAALTGLAVAAAAGTGLGRRGAVVAAALWTVSPMAATLSMTTHAHLVSRMCVALAFWLVFRLVSGSPSPVRDGTLLGLAGGLGFLTRSPEAACALLPVAVWLLVRSRADAGIRRATAVATGVSACVLLGYAAYNARVTGVWYLPPRFGPDTYLPGFTPTGTVLERLGDNLGHNLLLLIVLGLGPAGALLAGLGVRRSAPWALLASGVALQFGLTLCHDDTGIHSVGPIHFSETLPALVLLATAGLLRVVDGLDRHGVPRAAPAAIALGTTLAALALLTAIHGAGLRAQAANASLIRGAVERARLREAVVVGERPVALMQGHPELRHTGSWVKWFPPPDPYLRDEVIFAYASADLAALRAAFPGRRFYRMTYHAEGEPVRIRPLAP